MMEKLDEIVDTKDEGGIDYRDDLSKADFIENYVKPRRPVVIRNAIKNWSARHWTPDNLAQRLAHHSITYRTPEGPCRESFAEAIKKALDPQQKPAVYLRNINICRDLPELCADISPNLIYAGKNWKDSPLLPPNFLVPKNPIELFIGGQGTRFPVLHIDYWGMFGLISQIFGRKKFILFHPDDSPFLYPLPENPLISCVESFENPDLERFPEYRQARKIEFVLEPGESLYNPGYWHTTRMLSPSITVIESIWNRWNWDDLITEIDRTSVSRGYFRSYLIKQYLRMIRPLIPFTLKST